LILSEIHKPKKKGLIIVEIQTGTGSVAHLMALGVALAQQPMWMKEWLIYRI